MKFKVSDIEGLDPAVTVIKDLAYLLVDSVHEN